MRMPRISIATVMLVIVLAALDLAAWRAVTRSTVHEPSNLAEVIVALLPTLNIVAVLAYHFARRVWRLRREGKPITLPDRLILALGIVDGVSVSALDLDSLQRVLVDNSVPRTALDVVLHPGRFRDLLRALLAPERCDPHQLGG